jgi:hypothetical protein
MDTPPERISLHENAISHCIQARVQVANQTLSTHYPHFWDMPRDAAIRDLIKVAIGYPAESIRIGTERIIAIFEQGDPMFIQGMQEENPGCSVKSYIDLYKYILANLDELDAEAKLRLEEITEEEVIEIIAPEQKTSQLS